MMRSTYRYKFTECGTGGIHQFTAEVDKRGNLTYPGVGWAPVAGVWCYKCQTYIWDDKCGK